MCPAVHENRFVLCGWGGGELMELFGNCQEVVLRMGGSDTRLSLTLFEKVPENPCRPNWRGGGGKGS